jgi:hypothetical protein
VKDGHEIMRQGCEQVFRRGRAAAATVYSDHAEGAADVPWDSLDRHLRPNIARIPARASKPPLRWTQRRVMVLGRIRSLWHCENLFLTKRKKYVDFAARYPRAPIQFGSLS